MSSMASLLSQTNTDSSILPWVEEDWLDSFPSLTSLAPICGISFTNSCLFFKHTKPRTFRLETLAHKLRALHSSFWLSFFPSTPSRISCYLWQAWPMLATLLHPFSQWHHNLGRKCYPFCWLWVSLKPLALFAWQIEESKDHIITIKMAPNNQCLVSTSWIKLKGT